MAFIKQRFNDTVRDYLANLPLNVSPADTPGEKPRLGASGYYSTEDDAYFLENGSDYRLVEGVGVTYYYSLVLESAVVKIDAKPKYTNLENGRRLCTWDIKSISMPSELTNDLKAWEVLLEALIASERRIPDEPDCLISFIGNVGNLPINIGEVY